MGIEFRVAVENDVPVRNRVGECFAEVLHDPVGCRLRGHIEMEDASPTMLDHEEAVQETKRDCRNGKEVEGDDGLSVIVEEGQPTLRWIASATHSPQVLTDGSFRDDEAELQKFTVDFRCAPAGILRGHSPNQTPDFLCRFGPATARS